MTAAGVDEDVDPKDRAIAMAALMKMAKTTPMPAISESPLICPEQKPILVLDGRWSPMLKDF